MSHIELIEYASANKAREALIRLHGNDDVERIDLIGDNRVLRVTFHNAPVDDDVDDVDTPETSPAPSPDAAPATPVVEPEQTSPTAGAGETDENTTSEAADASQDVVDDLIGTVAPSPASEPSEAPTEKISLGDFKDLDRKALAEFVDAKGLDVKIHGNTPLVKEVAKVAAALGVAVPDDATTASTED